MVRAVHQYQLGISIRQLLDFIDVKAEVVFLSKTIAASFDPKRFGQGRKWSIAWLRNDDIGFGLRGQPHQKKKSLRGAGYDLDSVDVNTMQVGDRFAQSVGSRRAAVNQIVIQEALPLFFAGEAKDFIQRPGRSGAGPRVDGIRCCARKCRATCPAGKASIACAPRRIRSANHKASLINFYVLASSIRIHAFPYRRLPLKCGDWPIALSS